MKSGIAFFFVPHVRAQRVQTHRAGSCFMDSTRKLRARTPTACRDLVDVRGDRSDRFSQQLLVGDQQVFG